MEISKKETPANLIPPVYIDSFKSFHEKWEEEWRVPELDLLDWNPKPIHQYFDTIAHRYSHLLGAKIIVPFSKKNPSRIFTAQVLEKNLVRIVKWEIAYLGGETNPEKIFKKTQGKSQSFLTNRVYFTIQYAKYSKIDQDKKYIWGLELETNLKPFRSENQRTGFENIEKIPEHFQNPKQERVSELFDEKDRESSMFPFLNSIQYEKKIWKLDSVVPVFTADFETICIKPIFSEKNHLEFLEKEFLKFFNWREEEIQFANSAYKTFLENVKIENQVSQSGNILWKASI